MTPAIKKVLEQVDAQKGVMVRVQFLRADGSLDYGLDAVAVADRDLLLNERALAYIGHGAERFNAHKLRGARWVGDELVLDTEDPTTRVILEAIVLDEEKARVEEAREMDPKGLRPSMTEVFNALSR